MGSKHGNMIVVTAQAAGFACLYVHSWCRFYSRLRLRARLLGLIAQMTGFRTTKRYRYATVYIDQGSRLSFTYLQKTATAEETFEGKQAFEKYSEQRGVRIRGYHANNGIFKANKWVLACRAKGFNLSFAGVNTQHQNGMAERRIRLLQELTRTMLIHASKQRNG